MSNMNTQPNMEPTGPPDYIILEWENGDRIRISDNDIAQIISNINRVGPLLDEQAITRYQLDEFTSAGAAYALNIAEDQR